MPTLDFKGKQLVYAHHLTVSARTLKIDVNKSHPSKKPSLDGNLIIHGDNLHALKALMPRYAGRVNCIYIDPPYNTGNEKWLYNDNVNSPMMQNWLKDKGPVDGEDLERHDKWLCMMWPRLQLLRELLAEDGVIFISIDDNEQHRLRMMMDEVFGVGNFYASLAWESKTKPANMGSARFNIQTNTESIMVYGKVPMTKRKGFNLYATEEKTHPLSDEEGEYRLVEFQQRRNLGSLARDTMVYPIHGMNPKKGYRWQVSPGRYKTLESKNRVVVKGAKVFEKIYNRDEDSFAYEPFWSLISKEIGTSESGKSDLNDILGRSHGLETVKPSDLVKKLIYHCTNKDALILDSYAGSGTTAHAVLALNKEDGGNRKFILIECEEYAHKITAERVRRVIKGVPKSKDENLKNGLGGTFTYCTLGDEISIEKMLTGKHLPDYETFARHLVYVATGKSPDKIRKSRGKDGFFLETPDRLFYLIYEPTLTFLRSIDSALNGDRAERIAKQAKTKKKTTLVFATHKFMGQKELTEMNITFCQLPYANN